MPYRVTHSLLFWLVIGGWIAVGAAVHLMLDWPTHRGRMQQQPLWPIEWRWPWLM